MPKPRDSAEFLSSPPASDPILEAWSRVLAERAEEVAVLGGNGEPLRTFSQIEEESRTCGERFKGLPEHAVVAVKIGNSPSWPAVFLALLRAGHVTLPLGSDAVPPERLAVATVDESLRLQGCNEGDALRWRPPLPPEITLLKLTSGTTGTPRAIRFTSAQLLADCDQICETMGITAGDVNFGAIPIAHSYGFSNLLTPLLLRGVRLALTEDRLPRALLTGFGKTGATVFPGTPVLFQHLAEVDAARPDQLRLCISAGAPLKPAVWESFRTRYGLCIHVFYGSSECGGIAYSRGGNLPEEGFVGQAMTAVTITPQAMVESKFAALRSASAISRPMIRQSSGTADSSPAISCFNQQPVWCWSVARANSSTSLAGSSTQAKSSATLLNSPAWRPLSSLAFPRRFGAKYQSHASSATRWIPRRCSAIAPIRSPRGRSLAISGSCRPFR
jgi:acyl-CoA synthetase (AMP-forming)/AMP-acid ligase II